MTWVVGSGVRAVVTDAAATLLGKPLLVPIWHLLEAHGDRVVSEHTVGGGAIRIARAADGALIVGLVSDFTVEAA